LKETNIYTLYTKAECSSTNGTFPPTFSTEGSTVMQNKLSWETAARNVHCVALPLLA